MPLLELGGLLVSALRTVDDSGVPYASVRPPLRQYKPGVGPYSETRLCERIVEHLRAVDSPRCALACTRRTPDILIPGLWAVELKIARPFGDNGKEAEHWSQNLLHPYPGNTSSLGDAMKLMNFAGGEHRAVVVVGYEHLIAQVSLDPLIIAFETIAKNVLRLPLSSHVHIRLENLRHPVHQVARVWIWEVLR